MNAQSMTVTFSYNSDANTKDLVCDYVVFGIEFIGQVDEMLDFSLEEDYDGVRQTIELQVALDLSETLWVAEFLAADDKKLTIDGTDYEIVNQGRRANFPLFKKSYIGTHPKLKFMVKTLGIADPGVYSGALNDIGQLQG